MPTKARDPKARVPKVRYKSECKASLGQPLISRLGLSVVLCLALFLNVWANISQAQEKSADEKLALQDSGLHGIEYDAAVLRILDKMVAKTRDVELAVEQEYFDDVSQLSILVKACRKPPPTLRAEVAVYLEISDLSVSSKPLFSGWMLASAPALSAMEHPLFDIWVLDCNFVKSQPSSNTQLTQ